MENIYIHYFVQIKMLLSIIVVLGLIYYIRLGIEFDFEKRYIKSIDYKRLIKAFLFFILFIILSSIIKVNFAKEDKMIEKQMSFQNENLNKRKEKKGEFINEFNYTNNLKTFDISVTKEQNKVFDKIK